MAVASGRAGRVLVQPLFRGLNVHVRNLNTSEVVCIKLVTEPSLKTAANHRTNFTDKKVTF